MQERAQQNFEVSMGISAHEVTLDQLANEIAEVYERCGFDRDATVSTLQMLTNIEVSTQFLWFPNRHNLPIVCVRQHQVRTAALQAIAHTLYHLWPTSILISEAKRMEDRLKYCTRRNLALRKSSSTSCGVA